MIFFWSINNIVQEEDIKGLTMAGTKEKPHKILIVDDDESVRNDL